tara:strand:- start:6402 stop:6761 length:360 start_codon:yes stop_codon:yes gene_type:complete
MRGARTSEKTLQIWEAYRQGYDAVEIAKIMGLPRTGVSTALARGRKNGSLPAIKRTGNLKHLLMKHNLRNGHIREVFDNLTMEQTRWLVSQASEIECQTVSEFLIELVRDEYERENDNG